MKKIIIILYGIFLLFFSLFSYAFIDINFFYLEKLYSGITFEHRFVTTAIFTFFITVFFTFYLYWIYACVKGILTSKDIKILVIVSCGTLLVAYPAMLSNDIFNYIATAKVLFTYHENPYIIMPIEFTGDPLLKFMHAANKTALYGFVWILLTGIPFVLGFSNIFLTLFSFKLFITIFYLLTIYYIGKITKQKLSMILFGLNPLVLIETMVSGHNDIVMMFFALVSLWVFLKRESLKGIVLLLLSIFIKYASGILVPLYLYMYITKHYEMRKMLTLAAVSMFCIFFLSSIREEIYPWYAIWFLIFVVLIPQKRVLLTLSILFSFSLLFRYIPYMFFGTYGGITQGVKTVLTFAAPSLYLLFILGKTLWVKVSSR